MNLGKLTPADGSTKNRKRIGRGEGSGRGGTSTRGHKGQKSRSGNHAMPSWFEGGQMPLQRRIPKFGFKNRNRIEYRPINVSKLAELIESGQLSAGQSIGPEQFQSLGLAGKQDRIKILGDGDLKAPLEVSAHAFSAAASKKIESVGGKAIKL